MAEVVLQDYRQVVQSNATVTTTGSAIFDGFGAKELNLIINNTNAPTGTTPTITYSISEVDPGNLTTLLGNTATGTAISTVTTQIVSLPIMYTGTVQVTWTVTGTTPSFTGLYASLISKVAGSSVLYSPTGVPVFGTAGSPGAAVLTIQGISGGQAIPVTLSQTDRTGTGTITTTQTVQVNSQGSASTGVVISGTWTGTIVFEASVDGTNFAAVNAVVPTTGVAVTSTTANGNWEIASGGYQLVRVRGNTVATGTATATLDSGAGTQVVEIGAPLPTGTNTIGAVNQGTSASLANGWATRITDGTNGPAAVKAASTAAVATDPALVVAISPNNSLTITSADVSATGALGSNGANVVVTHPGLGSVGFQLAAGTFVGTIIPQVSYDGGTTWNASYFADPSTLAVTSSLVFGSSNTAAAKTIIQAGGSGMTRVFVSAYTSGTANATVRASDMEDQYEVYGGPAGLAPPPGTVQIGGTDGTLLRALSTDTSGRQLVVGPAAGAAAIVGNPVLFAPLTDNALVGEFSFGEQYRLRVGVDSLAFLDNFDGSTVNTVKWAQSTSTMTQAQTQTSFNMNSGGNHTTSTYSILTSNKAFAITGEYGVEARIKANLTPVTSAVIELGFLAAATTSAPTNGVFFRITSAGTQQLVINFNGTETTSTIASTLTNTSYYTFVIYMYGTIARLDILNFDNSVFATTTLQVPVTQGALIQLGHIPVAVRVYDTGSAPASAANALITGVSVSQMDVAANKSWEAQLGDMARFANLDPNTGVQLQQFANSTAPSTIAAASLSNTAAAYTTLGGLFAFNTPASAETDFILFAYQVPANYDLMIWSVTIQTMLLGAQSSTQPTVLQWGMAVGSSAVSLATAGSNPPIRQALGMQTAPKSSSIGDTMTPAQLLWTPRVPLVCYGGKYVHIIVRVPSGNLTAGQVNRGIVTIDGVFQ